MTRRIFCTVKRGITDATAVCIYPWEKPILERIHGGEVAEQSIDELCDLKKPLKVEKLKFSRAMADDAKPEQAPGLREQLEAMVIVDPEDDPANDPDAEYARLEGKYGADKEIPMPVVSVVYGQINSGAFAAAVKEAQRAGATAKAKTSRKLEKPVDQMSINEVRSALKAEGIEYDQTAKLPALRDLLATATA